MDPSRHPQTQEKEEEGGAQVTLTEALAAIPAVVLVLLWLRLWMIGIRGIAFLLEHLINHVKKGETLERVDAQLK